MNTHSTSSFMNRLASAAPGALLGLIYVAFTAWLYVTYPAILALFCGALLVVWMLEATKRFLRTPALARARIKH